MLKDAAICYEGITYLDEPCRMSPSRNRSFRADALVGIDRTILEVCRTCGSMRKYATYSAICLTLEVPSPAESELPVSLYLEPTPHTESAGCEQKG